MRDGGEAVQQRDKAGHANRGEQPQARGLRDGRRRRAAKAANSILPSSPRSTTPERSDNTPPSRTAATAR